MIFFVPVTLKRVGDGIFILSGLLSLAFIYLFLIFMVNFILKVKKKTFNPLKNSISKGVAKRILGVYLIFNLMYFLNIIPPVPLSMKELGIYQNVERVTSGDYRLEEYKQSWYQIGDYFLKVPSGTVYVYGSVFAPTDLNTTVTYVWEKYSPARNRWSIINEISYPIKGGREMGYRGYSFINNATTGNWKVYVKNENGQVLGRVKFRVE